jgi:excisionase family DNA binding protein
LSRGAFFVLCADDLTKGAGHVEVKNEARKILSPEELAEYLGCGRTYAYSLLAGPTPCIRSFKIGRLRRIRQEEVDRYVAERMRET